MVKQNNLKQIPLLKIESNHTNNLGPILMHMLCNIADYLFRAFNLNKIICSVKPGLYRKRWTQQRGFILPIVCYILLQFQKIKIKNSIVIPFILGKMGNIHPENLSKIILKKMNYCQFRYTTYFLFLKSEITI